MKRVTIKEVANEAGVSISAVSRAFSEGSSLAHEKRTRILEVAEELGYRPSTLAQGLVRNRSNTVTLVSGEMSDPFDAIFLEQLAEALSDRGKRLIVAPASKQGPERGGMFQALDDRSDVVIVAAGTMPLNASEACVRVGLPVILTGRILDIVGIDCVAADNEEGGRQAAMLLVRTGCRQPVYFGFAERSIADQERQAGFCMAFSEMGSNVSADYAVARSAETVFDDAVRMLSARNQPDSVFCATDRLAFGVIEAARAQGLNVPGDISVIGFNNIPAAAWRSYRLTTINYPVSRVVTAILNMMDQRMENPGMARQHLRIPVSLVVRDSTRVLGQ